MYVFCVLCLWLWFHLMKACSVAEHCNALGGLLLCSLCAASVALLIFSFRGLRGARWCSDPSRPCRWDGSCHTVGRHIQTVKCHKNVRGSPVGCVAHTLFSDTPLNETKEKARPPFYTQVLPQTAYWLCRHHSDICSIFYRPVIT